MTAWTRFLCGLALLGCCCLPLVTSVADPGGSGSVASRYFTLVSSAPAAASQPVSVSPARSDIECAGRCASRLDCKHFDFAEKNSRCSIYSSGGSGGGSFSGVTAYEADATNCPYVATLGERSFCTIQERNSASVSFERVWTEYEAGFGDGSNFWIGLQRIHELTFGSPRTLRIRFLLYNNSEYYNEYGSFTVGNSATKYQMNYASFLAAQSNLASDCLAVHNGMKFSTMNQDNDNTEGFCAIAYGKAGFWFNYCLTCNPNGWYATSGDIVSPKYAFWKCVENNYTVVRSISMMVQV